MIQELKVSLRKQSIEQAKTSENLITLENYCERYVPIVVINKCRDLM